jgi:hypothetical protein
MRMGSLMSVVLFLAGIWVAIMPRLVGFQPATGNPWTSATLASVILGGGIALASLVGMVGFWGLQLREQERRLRRLAERRARERAREAEAAQASSGPRVLSESRPEPVRKLSRVERAAQGTQASRSEDSADAALRQLAQSILQDLQRPSSH